MFTELEVHNLKAIGHIALTLTSNLLAISGPCAQGKSSLAGAARFLITGEDPPPVRTGETEAKVAGTWKGEYHLTRTYKTPGGWAFKITKHDADLNKDIAIGAPAGVMKALLHGAPVDVEDVLRMEPKDQVKTFLTLQGPDMAAKLKAAQDKEAASYKLRAKATANAVAKKQAADAIVVPQDIPTEMVVESARRAVADGESAHQNEKENARLRAERSKALETCDARVLACRDDVRKAKEVLQKAEFDLEAATIAQNDAQKAVDADADAAPVELPDLEALRKTYADLLTKSGQKGLKQQKETFAAEAAEFSAESARHDADVKAARAEITALFSGLTCVRMDPACDADNLALQGLNIRGEWVPLKDLSDSESIVDMANILAEGGAPFVRIKHGAELDAVQWAALAAVAEAHPQTNFWVERVTETGEGLVIRGADVAEGAVTGPVLTNERVVDMMDELIAAPLPTCNVEITVTGTEISMGDAIGMASIAAAQPVEKPDKDTPPVWAKPGGETLVPPTPQDDDPPVTSSDPNQTSLL